MVSWRKRVWNYARKLMKQKRIYCYYDRVHISGAHNKDIIIVHELITYFSYETYEGTRITAHRLEGSWKKTFIQKIGIPIHFKQKDQAYKALYLKLITHPKLGWKKYKK
jgi:hypothetical protein